MVVNSRDKKSTNSIWRRRKCTKCGAISTTFEEYDLSTILIVKKRSGALEGFQRDKLLISVANAISHRQNAPNSASELTKTIIQKVLKNHDLTTYLNSKNISDMASIVLKHYDAASSIRYLSFHSSLKGSKDIKEFLD